MNLMQLQLSAQWSIYNWTYCSIHVSEMIGEVSRLPTLIHTAALPLAVVTKYIMHHTELHIYVGPSIPTLLHYSRLTSSCLTNFISASYRIYYID